jgi:hypothetical protein
MAGGKQTGVHLSFKQGIGWLDLFEAVDSKVLGFGIVGHLVGVVVFVSYRRTMMSRFGYYHDILDDVFATRSWRTTENESRAPTTAINE